MQRFGALFPAQRWVAGLTGLLLWLATAAGVHGQAEKSKPANREPAYVVVVGKEVILKSFDTPLLEHGHWIPTQGHFVFLVDEIQDDKVHLVSRDKTVRGWLSSEQLVPLDFAIDYLGRVLSRDRRNTDAYWTRGRLWLYRNEPERALTNLDLAIRLDPDRPAFYLTRSLVHLREKRFDQAIADCDRVLQLDPQARQAYVIRAQAWLSKDERERARADLDAALRLDITNPSAPANAGSAEPSLKNAGDGAVEIKAGGDSSPQPKEPEPRSPADYVARGKAHYAKAEYDDAIADYTAATRLDATYAPAYMARAQAWAGKHYREREAADIGEAIKLEPKNTTYRVARADSYSAQGMHEEALADYDEALRMEPENPANWVARGKEWQRDYKVREAIADYTRAIQLDPNHTPAYFNRGLAWKLSGDYERAIQEFAALARIDPDNVLAHQTLARILATSTEAKFRDGRRALQEATRACELTQWGNPDALDTLAAACAETGDFSSAIKWQTRAIALVRQNVPAALRGPMDFGLRRGIGFEDRLAFYKSKKPTRE